MKLLLAGVLFGVVAWCQQTGRVAPPGADNPEFSLFRMPDLAKPSAQALAEADLEARQQAQLDKTRLHMDAEIRRRRFVRLGICFAVLAMMGILGPALARQAKALAAKVVALPGSEAWRELQTVDLCGHGGGGGSTWRAKTYRASWLDRVLVSGAAKWLDKVPAYEFKGPKLEGFLESAKFLDRVPGYLVPE